MGYRRHHAIIVTGCDYAQSRTALAAAHKFAQRDGGVVSPIVASRLNGYLSFALFPDGSKEGWNNSNEGDAHRAALIEFMDGFRYADGSSPLAWVEVQYGDDDGRTCIISHSDEPQRVGAAPPSGRKPK
jgi:hypothetical protein